MSTTLPRPFVPVDLTTEFVSIERRVSLSEMRERGIGRGPWRPVVDTRGLAVHDGAIPGWRRLNDGRIEIRGRLKVSSLANGTAVLRLPAECAPPGVSSVSAVAPCSSAGTNNGMVRVDFAAATAPGGEKVTHVIAYPGSPNLTEWIGFDHVIYDPHLYIDVLPPVERGQEPVVPPDVLVVVSRRGQMWSVIPGTTPDRIPQPTRRHHR